MRVAFFSAKEYEQRFFGPQAEAEGHELVFLEPRLSDATVALARDFPAICAFVNDEMHREVVHALADGGARLIALRAAGFNNVDLAACQERDVTVVRVPAYSPHAVAEHAVALLLTLNRKIHRAFNRVREGNFSLNGLLGFDLRERTVGVVGTGRIGCAFAEIMLGFGCRVLAFDVQPRPELQERGVQYVEQPELFAESEIISLHCPLMEQTHHLINAETLGQMQDDVFLINTSRGALIDTPAVVAALKSGRLGGLALDVYEEEDKLFFQDRSSEVIADDVFARLLTFPNVLITGHQGFFTREALENIAGTTISNISDFAAGRDCPNVVRPR